MLAISAVVPRSKEGKFVKGYSGNRYELRSLRQIRKYISQETNGNQELIQIGLQMARGQVPDGSGGTESVPYAVRAKVWAKLMDTAFGKEIRKQVNHTGTVTHVAKPATQLQLDNLTQIQIDALEDALRALEAKREIIDAEFTQIKKEEVGDGNDRE